MRFVTPLAVAATLSVALAAFAQTTTPAPAAAPADPPANSPIVILQQAETRPPSQRLGVRATVFRATQTIVPDVVIVDNDEDAAAAMGAWRGLLRFPVLIDDGSRDAAEQIGRFVRAFQPRRVVRWKGPDQRLPVGRAERQAAITALWAQALLGEDVGPDQRPVIEHMRSLGLGINGVVAIDPADDAWIGGLALALGRVQVIAFVEREGGFGGLASPTQVDRLRNAVTQQINALGLSWQSLGDDIDAVTLALNTFTRVDDAGYRGDNTQTAITDRLPRLGGPTARRFAWAGILPGDPRSALYRAMSALFLPIESAWLFDGYGPGQPWEAYSLARAGQTLEQMGLNVSTISEPANTANTWTKLTSRGLRNDLVMINSKGMVNNFNILETTLRTGDLPHLHYPAAAIMVHSWSTQHPQRIGTIAGRWLANGAYVWYGSVQEPNLSAFIPGPDVAERLRAGLPFAAAVAFDNTPAWKVLYLGDPLVTLAGRTSVGTRLNDVNLPFQDAEPVEDAMSAAVRARRFDDAARDLVILGRDADASRLARSLLAEQPDAVTPNVAAAAILALFRDSRYTDTSTAFARLDSTTRADPRVSDALWHAMSALPPAALEDREIALLGANLRQDQLAHDARILGSIIRARSGPQAAFQALNDLADALTQDGKSAQAARVRQNAEQLRGR